MTTPKIILPLLRAQVLGDPVRPVRNDADRSLLLELIDRCEVAEAQLASQRAQLIGQVDQVIRAELGDAAVLSPVVAALGGNLLEALARAFSEPAKAGGQAPDARTFTLVRCLPVTYRTEPPNVVTEPGIVIELQEHAGAELFRVAFDSAPDAKGFAEQVVAAIVAAWPGALKLAPGFAHKPPGGVH